MRFEVNLSILFTELPLLDGRGGEGRPGSTRSSSGGRGRSRCPSDADVDAFASAVTDAGVQLVGLNFFAGDMAGGDRGLVSWPARSAEFRDNIDVTVGIGERLGCRAFNALYGNRTDDSTPAGAGRAGHREPRARGPGGAADRRHRAGRAGQRRPPLPAAHRGRRAGGDRPGGRARTSPCCCDVYHLAVNGDDVDAAIDAAAGRIGHVQIADAPGRNEPGTGKLDIDPTSTASRPPATTAGSGSSTSPPARAPTPSTGCPASAARPADLDTQLDRVLRKVF